MSVGLNHKMKSAFDRIYTFFIKHRFSMCKGLIRTGLVLIGGKKIKIGKGSCIGHNCILTVWPEYSDIVNPEIIIQERVSIGDYSHISATNGIYIGDGVLTGRFVSIVDNNHGNTDYDTLTIPPMKRKVISKGPIIIEKNVWIGDKVTILSGVSIGEGAVIAANSVVTRNVPPFSIIAGNPGRIIKQHMK